MKYNAAAGGLNVFFYIHGLISVKKILFTIVAMLEVDYTMP